MYVAKLWVDDTRPEDKRNKSGRRKVSHQIRSGSDDPTVALQEVADALAEQPEEDRQHVQRIQLDREGPGGGAFSLGLD